MTSEGVNLAKLIIFNKPFRVLSQFSDDGDRSTLAQYIKIPAVYPAGRLDYDSEGLLLLTDNGYLQSKISHPRHKLKKTYWVQVEGQVNKQHCVALRQGVELKDGLARALSCKILPEPRLWERNPPIRVRKNIPDSWLEITVNEGRNRQIRRMSAAIGLPTLRLVRVSIGSWRLNDLRPGEYHLQSVDI